MASASQAASLLSSSSSLKGKDYPEQEMVSFAALPIDNQRVQALLKMPYEQLVSSKVRKQADWKQITKDKKFWNSYFQRHWGRIWLTSEKSLKDCHPLQIAADLHAKDLLLKRLESEDCSFFDLFRSSKEELAKGLSLQSPTTHAWCLSESQIHRIVKLLWKGYSREANHELEASFCHLIKRLSPHKNRLGPRVMAIAQDKFKQKRAKYYPSPIQRVIVDMALWASAGPSPNHKLSQECWSCLLETAQGKNKPNSLKYLDTIRSLAEFAVQHPHTPPKARAWVFNTLLGLMKPRSVYLYSCGKSDFFLATQLAKNQGEKAQNRLLNCFRQLISSPPAGSMNRYWFSSVVLPRLVRSLSSMACNSDLSLELSFKVCQLLSFVCKAYPDSMSSIEAASSLRLLRDGRAIRCLSDGSRQRLVNRHWLDCDAKGKLLPLK